MKTLKSWISLIQTWVGIIMLAMGPTPDKATDQPYHMANRKLGKNTNWPDDPIGSSDPPKDQLVETANNEERRKATVLKVLLESLATETEELSGLGTPEKDKTEIHQLV